MEVNDDGCFVGDKGSGRGPTLLVLHLVLCIITLVPSCAPARRPPNSLPPSLLTLYPPSTVFVPELHSTAAPPFR